MSERTLFVIFRINEHWGTLEKLSESELDRWKLALKKKNPMARPSDDEWVRTSFQGQLDGDILIKLAHRVEPLAIHYQQYFSNVSGMDWHHGEFKNTFSEIDSITGNNLDEISLNNLIEVLKGELRRSGDSIEIFGIKIPTEAISTWGIIALVGLQLYFILHFNSLASNISKEDAEIKFPWIGMFGDIFSRAAFFASTVVLPSVVVAYNVLIVNGYSKYFTLILVFSLSIITAKSILRFQRINFRSIVDTEQIAPADS